MYFLVPCGSLYAVLKLPFTIQTIYSDSRVVTFLWIVHLLTYFAVFTVSVRLTAATYLLRVNFKRRVCLGGMTVLTWARLVAVPVRNINEMCCTFGPAVVTTFSLEFTFVFYL